MNKKDRRKLEALLFAQLKSREKEIRAALLRGDAVELVVDLGVAGRHCVGVLYPD
jgi:hypothetical protein